MIIKELKAMREQAMWIADEGVLQIQEIASGVGVWLMCLRKTQGNWRMREVESNW